MVLNGGYRVFSGTPVLQRLVAAGVWFEVASLERIAGIESLLQKMPGMRLTFGSYAPFFYFEAALLKLQESALTVEQLAAVCHRNAQLAGRMTINRRSFSNTAVSASIAPQLAHAASDLPSRADPAATAWGDAELRKLGIWDVHSHADAPGQTPAKRMEALVKIADRVGVERLCMSRPLHFEPTPEQFRKCNDEILEILKEWNSRVFGFVYLNPQHLRESLDELERCVADGPMIGIKLWVGDALQPSLSSTRL